MSHLRPPNERHPCSLNRTSHHCRYKINSAIWDVPSSSSTPPPLPLLIWERREVLALDANCVPYVASIDGPTKYLSLHRFARSTASRRAQGYKRANLGSEWKKPFQGASHAKGIVLEKMCDPG